MQNLETELTRLDDDERELLLNELDAFSSSLADAESKIPYIALRRNIEEGKIPLENIIYLENILELTLQSGRVRKLQSPQAEKRLLQLFNCTPRGDAIKRGVIETNKALAALKGRVLNTVSFTPNIPGAYRIRIDTDSCRVDLEINRQGVSVKAIEIDI